MHSRRWRAVLRLRISVVIQGVGVVREVLLVLVRRGVNDQVMSEGLRNICQAGRQAPGRVSDERT